MDQLLVEVANFIRSYNNNQIIVGISGHGASGKTTFAQKLLKLLKLDNENYINTDTYIIGSDLRKYTTIEYEYNNELHQDKMTACHPAAHHRFALERDIKMIRSGLDIYTIETNYTTSTFIPSSKKIYMIEGMTVAFTDPSLYDVKIYFHTDGDTELIRRSIRDVSERGTDIEYLRKSHEERRIQYELFMHPYHENFDIVIKNSNEEYEIERNKFFTM
ncbi:phosphoribulokinase [Bacillus sp. BGMRC 2118]|nr:phosphoribulokinase [Bacillus sp. BGMRC 2118]